MLVYLWFTNIIHHTIHGFTDILSTARFTGFKAYFQLHDSRVPGIISTARFMGFGNILNCTIHGFLGFRAYSELQDSEINRHIFDYTIYSYQGKLSTTLFSSFQAYFQLHNSWVFGHIFSYKIHRYPGIFSANAMLKRLL